MDCRETRTLLTAFHDGELPTGDRARVEDHLRGCPECRALLADLARADQAAGVPDPGPAYWRRFNTRVMERVELEADGPGVAVLRPRRGWMRQQLRYLFPAAAVAALVLVVVRYGEMQPAVRLTTSERATPVPAEKRTAKVEPGSEGQGRPSAGAGRDAAGSKTSADVAEKAEGSAVGANERFAAVAREERERPATPSSIAVPSPPPMTYRGATDGQGRPGAGAGKGATGVVAPARIAEQPVSGCELARTLARRERFREAEVAQRKCLAGDLSASSREKELVFLAELLDRQARFAEADAVITEVDRQFPQSRTLDLYRQRRPMVQKRPE
ncbi:MAG: anti-sigma factor family protein [Desulfobacteria bacterium]